MSVQSYGYNFGGTSVFHLFRFYAFFSKLSIFGDFQTLCVRRDRHKESTTCKLECEMNRGIHCKSGSSFMGLAVNAGLSISNEESQNIPHSKCPL